MWSPIASDKKREGVEDCGCGGGTATAAAAAAVVGAAADAAAGGAGSGASVQVERKINSKLQTSRIGGNLTGDKDRSIHSEGADKKKAAETGETVDSGFISGPQSSTTNIFSDNSDIETAAGAGTGAGAVGGVKTGAIKKYNINVSRSPPFSSTQEKHMHSVQQNLLIDSGCIDEVEENEVKTARNSVNVGEDSTSKQATTQQQVQRESSKATVANAASSAARPATTTTASTDDPTTSKAVNRDDQMLFKQNVDAGMSEWFCKLSLQTDVTPRSNNGSNVQPQQVAGSGLNDLNAPARRSRSGSNQQQQYSLNAAGNSASTTTQQTQASATNDNLSPSNDWVQFYQQNDDGDTSLHLACIFGYEDVVAALIRMAPHPCLLNIQNDGGQTALHLASLAAHPKILRMLLMAGAEPTIRDNHGNTALHLACVSGEEQCVRALTVPISASEINEINRQYGCRINDKHYFRCTRLPSDLEIRNYEGERCVHLAAQAGYIDILRVLVFYGADINAREGKSGRTPLHIAIECCNEGLANFLLDECQKLNLETETYAGLTAYQVACVLNKSQMQSMLERRGAEPLTPPDSDYDSSDSEDDIEDSKLYDRFGDPGYFANYKGGNAMTVA